MRTGLVSTPFRDRDHYRQFYELNYADWADLGPKDLNRIRQTLDRIPGVVDSALEVGCGDGRLLSQIGARCPAVGLDLSLEALKRFRAPQPRVQGSAESLPFTEDAFDLVLCTEVLEHLPQDLFDQVRHELLRVARRYVLVSVPDREDLREETVRCRHCGLAYHRYGHLRSFSAAHLKELFEPNATLVTYWYMGAPEPCWCGPLLSLRAMAGGAPPAEGERCAGCGLSMDGPIPGLARFLQKSCSYFHSNVAARWFRRPYWIGALYEKAHA